MRRRETKQKPRANRNNILREQRIMLRRLLICAGLVAGSVTANAGAILVEGFDNIAGLGASGWVLNNNSAPSGETGWFQGNTGIFNSQSGAADSYIAANYLNAGLGGNVENWLITPSLFTETGTVINFSTRTAGFPGDNLEVLYNNVGTTNLADFVSLGVIASASYPLDWQAFTFTYGAANADARFALRYSVSNTLLNGDYIGIDSLSVATVPEPGTMMLFGTALLLMTLSVRRRRGRA
jgi:hypothetical protein